MGRHDEMSAVPVQRRLEKTMKLLTALLALTMTTALWAAPTNVAYDTHDGYFVSNKFEPKEPTSFVVLQHQKAFDNVFGVAFVMRDKAHRLPKGAFAKNIVVAAIHRGKALVDFKVECVRLDGKSLLVRYITKSQSIATAEYACPLIVSLPKGDYRAVQFTEDGKDVTRIEVAPPLASPAAKPER